MRIRWRNFELPTSVVLEKNISSETYGRFSVEPFERGFGHTVGNGLRRVLLSSIEGASITSVKIDGVLHEFTSIPGVLEDVADIILNLKAILVRIEGGNEATLSIDVKRTGAVTAADIIADSNTTVVDPEQHIATLTDDTALKMEMKASVGRGYVTAEENEDEEKEIGVIYVDSNFSPVKRVRYSVEDTRVGKITNYDMLNIEVWTDGTVSPELALVEASKIYRKHLNPFVQYDRLSRDLPVFETKEPESGEEEEKRVQLVESLNMPLDELDFSVRARNCLDSVNLQTLADLVQISEPELMKLRNFGKTSLKEIKKKLSDLNLALGLDVESLMKG
jgi:DNA-directed RNA polymerase subunit alpha